MLSKNQRRYLQSLKLKKKREEERRFIVEGEKNVMATVCSDYHIESLYCTSSFYEIRKNLLRDYPFEIVKEDVLISIGNFKSNKTVLALVKMKNFENIPKKQSKDSIFILDNIQDPRNLGTIIRTLDWFGYKQLVCSTNTVDFYNPKVISGSMGSFTKVNPHYLNLEDFLEKENKGKTIYGTFTEGESLNTIDLKKDNNIIIIGSESHGISPHLYKYINHRVSIPKYGTAESLNAAISMAIFAHHLRI